MTEAESPASPRPDGQRRRSSYWFDGDDINGFNHRAWMKPVGYSDEAMFNRPVVGIVNTWSELVGCNIHLRALAESVRRGSSRAVACRSSFPSRPSPRR
jgi:dihydroxy-acid dehydratase